MMSESRNNSHSSTVFWDDCISQVIEWILADRTTTKENLHDKVRNYASNYIATIPKLSFGNNEDLIEDIADEVEEKLKDSSFDTQPIASEIANRERMKIYDKPENKFVKLR